jgi:hypothetical protein
MHIIKCEYRISKSETNSKFECSNVKNGKGSAFLGLRELESLHFIFRILNFENSKLFRISYFGFRIYFQVMGDMINLFQF